MPQNHPKYGYISKLLEEKNIPKLIEEAAILERIINNTEMQLEKELIIEKKEKLEKNLIEDKKLRDYILAQLEELTSK